MFNNSKKKIQILQDELYIAKLENASLRSRLAKAQANEVVKKTKKEPLHNQEFHSNKKTTTKKEAK
jgi:regulator of replication initiation timing